MNISFIGFGNMAKAIISGLAKDNKFTLSAASPSLAIGITKEKVHTYFDNKEVAKTADIIILAVKPGQMAAVLAEINPVIPPHCLLISVAAGLSLSWYAKYCKTNQAIIRTMPNTSAAVELSATPMIANEHTSPQQKHMAELIFSTIGITTWAATEEDMDTFTALSGSGPAYVYSFMEAMMKAAVSMGLDEKIAKQFTLQTVAGAAKSAQTSEFSLSELRTKVTSPGGTTAAALGVLERELEALILAAMQAAKDRARELGAL